MPSPKGTRYLARLELVPLLGLLLFVGIMSALRAVAGPGLHSVGAVGGAAVALAPPLLWLAYFYLLDRRQPEPTHYVLAVFLLGALVAAPLSRWLLHDLLGLSRWASLSVLAPASLAVAFLGVATAQELCKYLVVRYTVYLSPVFDERADGVVYGTAAGVGFAAAVNLHYTSHGIFLTVGAIEIVTTTLAHACFAGAWGYALGQAKFARRRGQITQAAGLLAGILLNGGFYVMHSLVSSPELAVRPWQGLAATVIFVAVVFVLLNLLMRRSLRQDEGERPALPPPTSGILDVLRRADALVLLTAAALLLGGAWIKSRRLERFRPCQLSGLSLRCPSRWMSLPGLAAAGERVLVDVLSTEAFKPRLVASSFPAGAEGLRRESIEQQLGASLGPEAALLHLLRVEPRRLDGREAVRVDYAYATRPAVDASDLPVVVRGSLLAVAAGEVIRWVRVEQSAAEKIEEPRLADRLLAGVRP